jgi:hypothetical protein
VCDFGQCDDRLVNRALRRAGWRVARIWEHELPRLKAPAFIGFRRGKEGQMPKGEPVRLVKKLKFLLE